MRRAIDKLCAEPVTIGRYFRFSAKRSSERHPLTLTNNCSQYIHRYAFKVDIAKKLYS